jgi:hypothetical protein
MRGNPKPSSIYWHHQLECYFNSSTLKAEKGNEVEKHQKAE